MKKTSGVIINQEEFKWDDNSVCIRRVSATSVYINLKNEVVIRQIRQESDLVDDDDFVIIHPGHVPTLINKLNEVMIELSESSKGL